MTLLTGSRHLGDDDLLRYIDHQLDREGMRLTGVHLRTCAECAGRLEGMRQKSAMASDWLSLLEVAAPDPARREAAQAAMERARFRRPSAVPVRPAWMKAAAAVVLMVGVGLATEPGRAFMAEGIMRAAGREPGPAATRELELDSVTLPPARTAPPPVAPAAPAPQPTADEAAPRAARTVVKPGMSAPVRFRPAGPDVTLNFASVQSVGIAQVWIREVPQASAQAVARYRGEEMAAGPAGLEVRNHEGSRADYTVIIPARYRYIRVRVGDAPEIVIHVPKSKQEWIWTVNLQTSALQ
jgi:hypothetical protein